MAAFAAMFRLLLTRGRVRPTRTSVLATIYAANAMSVSVPLAGPGLAAAYLFRRFTRLGPAPCSRAGRCWRAESSPPSPGYSYWSAAALPPAARWLW